MAVDRKWRRFGVVGGGSTWTSISTVDDCRDRPGAPRRGSFLLCGRVRKVATVPVHSVRRGIRRRRSQEMYRWPALSPHGRTVAYASGVVGREMRVLVRDLIGGQSLEIGKGQGVRELRWLPNGSQLLVGGDGDVDVIVPVRRSFTADHPVGHVRGASPPMDRSSRIRCRTSSVSA